MIIETIAGNLLAMFREQQFDAIVHGCNCHHMMGAGIAGQISDQFPLAFEVDCETPRGPGKLGSFSAAFIEPFGIIVNMYTQNQGGRERPEVLAKALHDGFTGLNELCKNMPTLTVDGQPTAEPLRVKIGIPMIGAGIAGGDWAAHEAIINAATPDIDITLVTYKP